LQAYLLAAFRNSAKVSSFSSSEELSSSLFSYSFFFLSLLESYFPTIVSLKGIIGSEEVKLIPGQKSSFKSLRIL